MCHLPPSETLTNHKYHDQFCILVTVQTITLQHTR